MVCNAPQLYLYAWRCAGCCLSIRIFIIIIIIIIIFITRIISLVFHLFVDSLSDYHPEYIPHEHLRPPCYLASIFNDDDFQNAWSRENNGDVYVVKFCRMSHTTVRVWSWEMYYLLTFYVWFRICSTLAPPSINHWLSNVMYCIDQINTWTILVAILVHRC